VTAHDDGPIDVGLRLPLHGARLIEAGAGTGKTFTLATLVLRLVLERGASMSRILVVTFTRAATQELRSRLRRRLRLARQLLISDDVSDDGEAAVAAAVVRAAVARDGEALVRQRLEAALLQIDEAVVATIHGFCHRALREFGFRAGLLGEQAVVDDAGEVWDEVATELWRIAANAEASAFGHADVYGLLAGLWGTPEALAADLPKLCDPLRETHPKRDASEAAAALHALRDAAIARFETRMSSRGECTQDQLIERLWRATRQPEFAAALAERWPLMLIDEFQDTDPQQWDIFRALYDAGDPAQRWLCLIGDPKQAIYRFRGGDLGTYLAARRHVVAQAQDGPALATLEANYRSAPGVLRAVDTVFGAHPLPFVVEDIAYRPLRANAAVRDGDLTLGNAPMTAMTVHWLPAAPQDPKAHPSSALRKGVRGKDEEFALMAAAAVHAIATLLREGRLRHGDGLRAVRPADIAVLVQTNDQVARMRVALANAGIGAAAIATASVFAGEAAVDLHALLAALAEPADTGRFRAALATRLLGWDAARIAALDVDDAATDVAASRFAEAAERWRARGPLPALLPFIVDAAPRWLSETGGTRRLTDALHLAELVQAESAHRHGAAEQLRWFARQCALASADELRQLRLESDSGLVQIATIHKSKGLEYPIVVLPFAAWQGSRQRKGLGYDDFHEANGQPARAWRAKGVLEPAQADAIDTEVDREVRAEAQRQLYVALTRAQHALHVVWSRNDQTDATALHHLLHDGAPVTGKDAIDHAAMGSRLEALAAASQGSIAIRPFDPGAIAATVDDAPRDDAMDAPPPARIARRRFVDAPRLHSFSSLHARSGDDLPPRGAVDEAAAIDEDAEAASLGGTAFGNAIHDVLEAVDAGAWRREHAMQGGLFVGDEIPASQRRLLEHALLRHGLAPSPAHLAQTARLVSRALNVALPGGARLCDLPAARQVREMPFHFRLRPTRIDAVFALLDAHGYPRDRRAPSDVIDGLMHGYIDLVYRDDAGRHHVLDYKTNRLAAYDPAALRHAVAVRDYDLQYLIYLVALRRWLKLRHGEAYDDAQHIGGAVYLFLRGIDPQEDGNTDASRRGVHVDPVPPALLSALDALFDGAEDAR